MPPCIAKYLLIYRCSETQGLQSKFIRVILQSLQQRSRNEHFVVTESTDEHARPQRLSISLEELTTRLAIGLSTHTLELFKSKCDLRDK
jgi:hypothetical protein